VAKRAAMTTHIAAQKDPCAPSSRDALLSSGGGRGFRRSRARNPRGQHVPNVNQSSGSGTARRPNEQFGVPQARHEPRRCLCNPTCAHHSQLLVRSTEARRRSEGRTRANRCSPPSQRIPSTSRPSTVDRPDGQSGRARMSPELYNVVISMGLAAMRVLRWRDPTRSRPGASCT
jgi:hypothetical protein